MAKILENSYSELVEKAQSFFWTQGYKGVSAKSLANHLEVSTSTIYNKYPKDMLFLASIDYYTSTYSDPFLKGLRASKDGLESLKDFFYALIDALLDKTFPKSCLMVNTVVELRNDNSDVVMRYDKYLQTLLDSYKIVLEKAYELGQIEKKEKIDDYAEFLLGIIFSLSIFYKLKSKDDLQKIIQEQLSFLK